MSQRGDHWNYEAICERYGTFAAWLETRDTYSEAWQWLGLKERI